MSFVKLDAGLLESTLWAARPQLQIFLAALLKAQPQRFDNEIEEIAPDSTRPTGYRVPAGWYGFVAASGPGLVRLALTGNEYSYEAGMKALASLAQPEAESRSSAFDGRRMIRINGGFVILNFMHYRDHDSNAAVRMKLLRDRRKASRQTSSVTEHVPGCSGTVTEAEAERARSSQSGEVVSSLEAISSENKSSLSKPPVSTRRRQSKREQERERMREITREAIDTFNATLGKPNGLLAAVNPRVGFENRVRQVKRCVATASEICAEVLGSPKVTREWWALYFKGVNADPFRSGRKKVNDEHEHWKPTFEYLTRSDVMLDVYERDR